MTQGSPSVLACSGLRFGYPGQGEFLGPIDLAIPAGEVHAVLGPNGSGKSTLLRLCAGLLSPIEGTVRLAGRPITQMGSMDRGRTLAYLPQRVSAPDGISALEVVLLGRYPHRRFRFYETAEDLRIAEGSLGKTETLDLADRPIDTLSGGESQRVFLAAALAQQPRLLVLDEPTAALDPYHQLHLFSILRDLAASESLAILVATHDLNLAARYCDRVLLLGQGRQIACGPPRDVLQPKTLESVYSVRFQVVPVAGEGFDSVLPLRVSREGANGE